MSCTVNKILTLAKSWIGKNEKDGSHKEIIDIYNAQTKLPRNYKVKYTDSWCATTISALAIKCGATDIIPTECSCQQMIELFKKKGIWKENENRVPNPGDIIFYDWQDNGVGDNKGWSDHVGIVESSNNGKIVVIEGNYQEAVKRRVISVNAKGIRGYGVPKYEQEKPPVSYYKQYTGKSLRIDTVFKTIGAPYGSVTKRKPVAVKNGYSNYKGTLTQNLNLIKLAKQGKLKK